MEEGSKGKRWRDCEEQQKSKKKCRLQTQHQTAEAAATPPDADEAASTPEGPKTKTNKKNAAIDESSKGDEQPEPEPSEKAVPANGTSKKNNGLKRFQRINDSQWTATLPAELKDNSFWKKKDDRFAVKAAEQLGRVSGVYRHLQVRGKDFRHEKTKKKKATWKGCGEIPMTVNSIQFASDSE
ncbi:hypothetical protein Emag_004430 [Eimeria magna]